MQILNFSHPLTEAHLEAISELVGQGVDGVREISVQFDLTQPFADQVAAQVDQLGISTVDWQNEAWIIVLPSLNYIAGVLLAELHGRMGHFPAILRQRPTQDSLVTRYEVAEIINLEAVRQAARKQR